MKNFVIAALLLSFFGACTSPREKALSKITSLEKTLFTDSVSKMIDKNKARELIEAYVDFSKVFPEDAKDPEFLFKAGDIANGIRQPVEALEYYSMVYEKYPKSDKAPMSLFLMGFINENNIKNIQKAKSYYEEFLQKYPDHQMAKDVKFSVEHLGMTDEELIKMFEEKNKESKLN